MRIGGSLALGIAVILGALYVRAHSDGASPQEAAVVAESTTRSHIETTDSDGDGIMDWEESLQAHVFESIAVPTTTDASSTEPYVPPTTLTGKFSEAFLKGYLNEKIAKGDTNINLTDAERADFINSAIAAAEQNTEVKHYTPVDIHIVPTSDESLRKYGNDIMNTIIKNPVKDINVFLILSKAIESNDPKILNEIKINEQIYKKVVADSLLIDVPEKLVETHIELLDSYEALQSDFAGMQLTFDDTLYSLMHVRRYGDDNIKMLAALRSIKKTLMEAGVFYDKNEIGSLFYSPEI
jgi:hypothetical protein